MKKFSPFKHCLLTFLIIATLCGPAEANAPWKWQQSLKTAAQIGAMLLPTTLFIDVAKERYYVVDSGNNRLLSFDRKGLLLHSFNANNELDAPVDMIRTDSGVIWVVEKGHNSLTEIDIAKKQVTTHSLSDNGQLVFPDRIEYYNDRLYVLNKVNGDILILDQGLAVLQRVTAPNEEGSGGFVDFKLVDNDVWALDQRKKTVYHYSADGSIANRVNLGDNVHSPVSLAIGNRGMIYVLDRLDATVTAFDQMGRYKYSFLGAGQTQGKLYFPSEIRFDPWGQLCVVDEGNGRVEIFSR
ncbi:MAG: hypothetical protein OEL66_03985 [Desulfobulbaceae bacterium]|nr:hypothetical protein [Desulfobulbaceae bacterium]